MSTSAQVQAAWLAAIWQNATMLAITDKMYGFDITTVSEKETARLSYQGKINYFQYLVKRATKVTGTNSQALYTFTVDVTYTRAHDVKGDSWTAVRDAFETLTGLVRSSLGATWTQTVDFWREQEGPPDIVQLDFDDDPVWRGSYRFTGYQQITL